ncbi:hypothetical protein [Mucilaginibacter aquatilis]|uniref:Uncharacterized protein n=1 Tax=Mucilaginibacter aquatilis TaxID=1517760 RepID=A0A6I4IQC7_9SPHI|nr:hypothetical protein [Mucilaginibacter aquatilis]MVN91453.1 hypothetical protein [Mucilaginibacter aquatilis]
MRALVHNNYYEITPDTEIVYVDGAIIPITDDGNDNWGFIFEGTFIPLNTFEVEGVIWYFTKDYQQVEIREFLENGLSSTGYSQHEIEWFKTCQHPHQEWNVIAYFKVRDKEIYCSSSYQAGSELALLELLANDLRS